MLGNHSCCNQPRIHHNGIHWRVPYKHIGHRQHNFLLRTHPCYIDKLKNRKFCGLLLHRMQKWIEERSLEEFLDHVFHFLMQLFNSYCLEIFKFQTSFLTFAAFKLILIKVSLQNQEARHLCDCLCNCLSNHLSNCLQQHKQQSKQQTRQQPKQQLKQEP